MRLALLLVVGKFAEAVLAEGTNMISNMYKDIVFEGGGEKEAGGRVCLFDR